MVNPRGQRSSCRNGQGVEPNDRPALKFFFSFRPSTLRELGEFEGREDYLLVALETIDSNISNYIYEFNYEIDATNDNKISTLNS